MGQGSGGAVSSWGRVQGGRVQGWGSVIIGQGGKHGDTTRDSKGGQGEQGGKGSGGVRVPRVKVAHCPPTCSASLASLVVVLGMASRNST